MNKDNTGITPEKNGTGAKFTAGSKPGVSGLLVFGLLPSMAVAFLVFAAGFISQPPKYLARATFVVDWNEMASVLGDDEAEKVRGLWRKEMIAATTALPGNRELSDMLDPTGSLGDQERTALASQARKQLRVTLVGHTDQQDSFEIEFRADNATQAEAVARRVSREKISDINTQAFVGRAAALARSQQNLDDTQKQQAEMRESGNGDSSALELQELAARLNLIGNGLGMLLTPAKPGKEIPAENQIGSHVVRVLCSGMLFGVMAGIGGLGLRKIAFTPKRSSTVTTPAASAVPPKLPSPNVPPVIAQFEMPKPPVMTPPMPRV